MDLDEELLLNQILSKDMIGYVQDHGVPKSGDVKKIEFEDV